MIGPNDRKLQEIALALFPHGIGRSSLLRLGAFDRADVAGGRVIAERGDAARWVYFVLGGSVDVGGRRCVPGDVMGDAPALAHTLWPNTATVVEGARLLLVPARRFEGLLAAVPELNTVIVRSLSARLVAEERQVRDSFRCVGSFGGRLVPSRNLM